MMIHDRPSAVERDPTAAGFGSVADVMERGDGVDGGAVLVENLRDYENQDYYTLITYALRGKEFGSLHRNDETVSCGFMKNVPSTSMRDESLWCSQMRRGS